MKRDIEKATKDAIERGLKNTKAEWRDEALECLRQVCLTMKEFTMDDVREKVRMISIEIHDNRAMGGVVRTAFARGWIDPTGSSIPSFVGHKTRIQIWRSKIYKNKK